MGKPRDLLKWEEISFDNHQSEKEAEWKDDLHFHKKMTVNNPQGRKTAVSGIFHVTKDKGVGVTYDKGKEHPKIKKDKEREFFSNKIKKEINDVIEHNNEEARYFLERVMEKIASISQGQNPKEIARRKNQAFDSIMDALGITPQRKVVLKNKNNDLLAFYVENQGERDGIDALMYLTRFYSRHYFYTELPGVQVNYITSMQGKLTMGELTPYAFLKYKRQGFKLTISGIIEALNSNLDEMLIENPEE